jgi:drug/metabolite transporter (DMT)-like permease
VRPLTTWLLFLSISLIWGSSFLGTKVGLEVVPPFTLVALRLGAAVAVLWALLALRRRRALPERGTWPRLALLALVNGFGSFELVTWGQQYISSANAAVLIGSGPVFTAVIAAVALREEPATPRRFGGILIGFLGVVAIFARPEGSAAASAAPVPLGGVPAVAGAGAIVLATLMIAWSAVFVRRSLPRVPPLLLISWQMLLAFPPTVLVALALERGAGTAGAGPLRPGLLLAPGVVTAVVWTGVFGAGIANVVFYRLLAEWGVTRTILVGYAIPLVGLALGAAAGEPVDGRMLAGTALVLLGIALVNLPGRAPRRAPP